MSRLEINSFGSALCWPYQANNDKLLCFVLISYYLLGEYKTEKKNRRRWKSSRVSGAVFRIVRRATPAPLSVGPSTVPHTTIKHPRNPAKGVCYIYSVCLIVATAISTVTSQETKASDGGGGGDGFPHAMASWLSSPIYYPINIQSGDTFKYRATYYYNSTKLHNEYQNCWLVLDTPRTIHSFSGDVSDQTQQRNKKTFHTHTQKRYNW